MSQPNEGAGFSGMRKTLIVASVLVVLVVAYFFIPTRTPKAEKRLTVLVTEIFAPDMNPAIAALCREWATKEGVQIDVETIKLTDLDAKLADLVQTGTSADLATFYAHKIPIYKDKLLDLTSVALEIEKQNGGFEPIGAQMARFGDRYFAVPVFAWSHVWVYNGAILEKHGLHPATTFDEARKLAIALRKVEPTLYPYGIGLGRDDDAAMFLQAVFWAYGARLFDESGRPATLLTPEARSAISYVVNLYQVDKVIPPGAFGWDGASNNKNFLAQKIVFTMNSPSILAKAKLTDPALAQRILQTTYPAGPTGRRFSYATGFAFAAPKDTKKRELIESLLRYLFRPDNYRKIIEAGDGAVNPWLENGRDLPMWKDPQLKPGIDSLAIERAVGWPGPVTATAAEVFERRILADIVKDVAVDGMPIDSALQKAEDTIRSIFQSNNAAD